MIDEIEDDGDDIGINKLAFVGSDRKNFNTFRMPLSFLSAIYNGEISLKEAEFKQIDLEKEIENLHFYYIPKNKEEKKEKSQVLMQANDLLEYRNKIIDGFKDNTFSSEYLKKSDNAAYDFMLKNVNKFIQEIRSMEVRINFSLFEDFLWIFITS